MLILKRLAWLNDEGLLQAAGADLVVTMLDDVSLDDLRQRRLAQGRVRE
jgi:hypothetical protein